MLVITEFFFIVLLMMMLLALYRSERLSRGKSSPRALIKECWNGVERRQDVRFTKNLIVDYAVEKRNRPENSGKIINVSLGGLKLQLDEKLPNGTRLDLKIHLPDNDKTAEVEGVVIWSEEAGMADPSGKHLFYSGIQFLAGKKAGNRHLSNYLRSIASQVPGE